MTDLTPVPDLDTWVDDQVATVDQLNSNVRDPQLFLAHAPLTIVTRAATQAIPSGSNTTVTFDTEVIDVDGMFSSPSTNLTVKRDGVYLVQFQGHLAANATGIRAAFIYVNGVDRAQLTTTPPAIDTCLPLSCTLPLQAGDVITALVYQDSGGNLNCGGSSGSATGEFAPRLAVRLVAAATVPVVYDGDGGSTPGTPTAPPSSPGAGNPTMHTSVFPCTWSRSFEGTYGNPRWNDPANMYQGNDQSGHNGNQRSLCGFNYKSIKSTLAGAKGITTQFVFRNQHTWYRSGGTMLVMAASYTTKPATWSNSRVAYLSSMKVSAGRTYTVTLPAYAGGHFQSGHYTAMGFGPGSTSGGPYYGYNAGYGQSGAPYMRFTYWK